MARLFEGMVLLELGYGERVQSWPQGLGEPVKFSVTPRSENAELHVDRNPAGEAWHAWGDPILRAGPGAAELRFTAFFDWEQLAPREFRWLQVLIERLDGRPDLVGRTALIEFEKCSIWLVEEEPQD